MLDLVGVTFALIMCASCGVFLIYLGALIVLDLFGVEAKLVSWLARLR